MRTKDLQEEQETKTVYSYEELKKIDDELLHLKNFCKQSGYPSYFVDGLWLNEKKCVNFTRNGHISIIDQERYEYYRDMKKQRDITLGKKEYAEFMRMKDIDPEYKRPAMERIRQELLATKKITSLPNNNLYEKTTRKNI